MNHVTPTLSHHTFQTIQNEINSLSSKINEFNENVIFLKDTILKSFEQLNLTNNIIKEITSFHQKVCNLHCSIFNRTNNEDKFLFTANHSENNYFTFNFNFNCSFFEPNHNFIPFPVHGLMNKPTQILYLNKMASDNSGK